MSPKKMPVEIAQIFQEISSEVSWLHARWIIYNQLFTNSKRVDLLNGSAGTLFYLLERVLREDVQMGLCKLTDPAKTCGKDNLTLEQVRDVINVKLKIAPLAYDLDLLLDKIKVKVQPFRTIRHKTLAHLDLKTHVDPENNPLPGATFDDLHEVLKLLSEFMNTVEKYFCESETGYEHFLMYGSDGDALVNLLKYGQRYEQLLGSTVLDYSDLENLPYKEA